MEKSVETAVFRGADPESMVAAGLACRTCLSGAVEWELQLEPFDHSVACRCRSCGHERTVALTPEQALRLSLHTGAALDAAPEPRSGLATVV